MATARPTHGLHDLLDQAHAVFGSDVAGEPSTHSCVALPTACKNDPSCECLATVVDDDSNLEGSLNFCLMEGSCGVEDNVLRVGCPGG